MRPQSRGRDNKGLQLTKAARCAPFLVRSWGQSLRAAFAAEARCSAYLEVRTHLNGQAIAVGARTGKMEPKKYSAGKGPGSEPVRSTLRMLAYRYEAEKRRPPASVEKRSSFLRLISIGANPSASFRLGSGWPGPIATDDWTATRSRVAVSVVRLSSEGTDSVVSSIRDATGVETSGNGHVAKITGTPNNGMQLTKAARCAPRATTQGQSLRAAFAADPECSTGFAGDRDS